MFYTLLRWLLVGRSGLSVVKTFEAVISQLTNTQKDASKVMDSHAATIAHLSAEFNKAQKVYDAVSKVADAARNAKQA